MTQTKILFVPPTTNTDGSAISQALSYTVFIDTVNPPLKSYAIPAADAAVNASGVVSATFAQLGFTPVNGTTYYAGATATDASGTSVLSAVFPFTYVVVPNAPTGFTVA